MGTDIEGREEGLAKMNSEKIRNGLWKVDRIASLVL